MKDEQLTNVLRKLVSSHELPKDCKPLDLLLVTKLLLQNADERDVYTSRITLALSLGCTEGTIDASIDRLQKFGWLVVRSRAGKGQPNRLGVILDKLPLDADLKRTIVGDDARTIAGNYYQLLKREQPKRRFFKGHLERWAYVFQKLLDKCEGDVERLRAVINFGLRHPDFGLKMRVGPHEIAKNWKSLRSACGEAVEQQSQTTQLLGYFIWFQCLLLSADAAAPQRLEDVPASIPLSHPNLEISLSMR